MADGLDFGQYLGTPASRQVADALRTRRDAVLQNWIQRVGQEPFHLGRIDRAVADHIPRLVGALIAYLAAFSEAGAKPEIAWSDLQKIIGEHAVSRLIQGLSTSEVGHGPAAGAQGNGSRQPATTTECFMDQPISTGCATFIRPLKRRAAAAFQRQQAADPALGGTALAFCPCNQAKAR